MTGEISRKEAKRQRVAKQAPENPISRVIVDAAYEVHRGWGPGLLETAYEAALEHELRLRGLRVERQVSLPAVWKGRRVVDAYRVDLLVEDCVLIEVKAVEALSSIHRRQTLTYLRLSGVRLGLLINFSSPMFRDGIERIANGMP